ncbi:hypothetical protein GKE82_24705 [Conexibacter sp. W3-3-2]|nr:hypothetical protein [Conexibacter sp. W3-3-2]
MEGALRTPQPAMGVCRTGWLVQRPGELGRLDRVLALARGSGEPVGIDFETDGLDPEKGARAMVIAVAVRGRPPVVVDVWNVPASEVLVRLHEHPGVLLAHHAPFELAFCRRELGVELQQLVCTRRLYQQARLERLGIDPQEHGTNLAACVRHLLGWDLDKRWQAGPWNRRPMSVGQIRYAGIDALVLPPLAAAITRWRGELGSAHALGSMVRWSCRGRCGRRRRAALPCARARRVAAVPDQRRAGGDPGAAVRSQRPGLHDPGREGPRPGDRGAGDHVHGRGQVDHRGGALPGRVAADRPGRADVRDARPAVRLGREPGRAGRLPRQRHLRAHPRHRGQPQGRTARCHAVRGPVPSDRRGRARL